MHKPIDYPPFEPPLSTDLLTSVSLTGTNHAEDQPVHLRVVSTRQYMGEVNEKGNMAIGAGSTAVESAVEQEDAEDEKFAEKVKEYVEEEQGTRENHIQINVGQYAGLLGRACPAGVYEYVPVEGDSNAEGNWNGHKLVINSQVSFHSTSCYRPPMCVSSVRIAFIASCAISRSLVKISLGRYQKEAVALSMVSSKFYLPCVADPQLSFWQLSLESLEFSCLSFKFQFLLPSP